VQNNLIDQTLLQQEIDSGKIKNNLPKDMNLEQFLESSGSSIFINPILINSFNQKQ
jgi:hypothetical protein